MQGDTGVAIAIRWLDTLVPGRYPAVLPDSADTTAHSSTVALRFLGRTTVTGYQSDSGEVTVVRHPDDRFDLTFGVRAKVPATAGRITLLGRAAGVPVREGGEECAAAGPGAE